MTWKQILVLTKKKLEKRTSIYTLPFFFKKKEKLHLYFTQVTEDFYIFLFFFSLKWNVFIMITSSALGSFFFLFFFLKQSVWTCMLMVTLHHSFFLLRKRILRVRPPPPPLPTKKNLIFDRFSGRVVGVCSSWRGGGDMFVWLLASRNKKNAYGGKKKTKKSTLNCLLLEEKTVSCSCSGVGLHMLYVFNTAYKQF